jgi:ketosteroid isomerase-like protein/ribosomal protein L40E
MKKCPSCYAILRESTKPTPVPALQQKPTDGTAEVSAVRVRHDCSQSAIVTGLTPLPSAEAQISSANGPSEPGDSQTGSPDPLGAPIEKMTEAGAGSTTKIVEAEPTSATGKEEVNQAGIEHSANATGQFCRHCGAAMESGSAFCGDCGTHKIRPDRLKISLSELIDEAMATKLSELIDEAMATKFCTQCGARVIEGKRFYHKCGQQIGKLISEAPMPNTAPAPALTPPEVEKAQTQRNSDGYDGLRGPAGSRKRSAMSLTHVDMLSIQHAIDLYEKNFPHQPSPSAEVALAWLASRRGHPGWRRGVASPVKRLITLLRHDRSIAAASNPQLVAEETPRHAWRYPITLAGGAIVVVVAAAVITPFHINNRQGSSVPSVTGDARQRTSLNHSPSQDEDTSSVESSSTIADHDQAGVPDVAVPKSDNHADIQNTLNDWAKAMNNNDVTLQLRYYSDRLDRYFLARNVTQEFVAQDKARFYRKGNHIVAFHIGNVTVDKQSGQQAAVSLIKRWEIFTGLGTKSGETRSRLWLTRRGNQWTITGEQDLLNLQPARSKT